MKMHSKYRYMFDAAPAASFRAQNGADLTASTAGDELVLDTLDGYWTAPYAELADKTFAVVANVTVADNATGDESYVLNLTTDNGVIVGTTVVTGVGQYVILIDADTLRQSDPDAASVSLDAVLGGTTPVLNFFAWLAPVQA